jgi:hypothetical protein
MDTLKERFLEIEIAALKMKLQDYEAVLKQYSPKPHWSDASRSLVMRLRASTPLGRVPIKLDRTMNRNSAGDIIKVCHQSNLKQHR